MATRCSLPTDMENPNSAPSPPPLEPSAPLRRGLTGTRPTVGHMKTSHRTMIALATTAALLGGGLAVQSQAHAQSDPSVLTYNIKQGQQVRELVTLGADWDDLSASAQSEACSTALAAVANDIEASGASVVALQEVDQYAYRSCDQDQAAEIAKLLGWPEPCFKGNATVKGASGVGKPGGRGYMGNAILSKSGVSNCRRVATMHSASETRGVVGATTTIDGTPVTVLSTHLSSKSEKERISEAKVVATAVNQISGPVVLTGDFNAEPSSRPISDLTGATGMTDSLPARGNKSPTTPGGSRIDHVLVRGLLPSGAKVLKQSKTSDHYPVRVNLRLTSPSGGPAQGQSSAKPLTSSSATPSATSTPKHKSKQSPSATPSTHSTSSTSGRTARPSTRATKSPSATPSSSTASGWGAMKGGASGSRSSGLRVR